MIILFMLCYVQHELYIYEDIASVYILFRAHVKSAFPQMKRFTVSPERQATSGMMAMNTDSQFILR